MAGLKPCWDQEELLSAYLDGELHDGELAIVVTHLENCAECLAVFHAVKEARVGVRLLPEVEPPHGLVPSFHVGESLSSYIDGELVTSEMRAVGRHLGECTLCRMELQEIDAARTAIRALPRLELPTELESQAPVPRRTHRGRMAVAVAAAGAVAAVGLVFAIGGGEPAAPLDLDSLATRHNARVSVESGFAVIPAGIAVGQP